MEKWKEMILGSDAAGYSPGKAEELIKKAEEERDFERPVLPVLPTLASSSSAPGEE